MIMIYYVYDGDRDDGDDEQHHNIDYDNDVEDKKLGFNQRQQ